MASLGQGQGGGFGVYQHAAISSALSAMSMRPSRRDITVIVSLSLFSSCLIAALTFRIEVATVAFAAVGVSGEIAVFAVRASQAVLTACFALTLSALHKAMSLQAAADASMAVAAKTEVDASSSSTALTQHQQALLGLSGFGRRRTTLNKKGTEIASELKGLGDIRLRPSRMNASPSQPSASPPHALMVPLHPVQNKANRGTTASDLGFLSLLAGPGASISPSSLLANPKSSYSSQGSPFTTPSYLTNPTGSPIEQRPTPWARQKSFNLKEDVQSEEKLRKFLSDTDTKMVEAAGKTALAGQGFMTPPPTIRGVLAANTPITSPVHNTPVSLSTPRGTPVRTLRLSPTQKGITPPKKGENELPSAMSLEEVAEGLHLLGVLPYIDLWRDALRQWFSEVLLNPLVYKIDSSHLQVMAAVGKLGQTVSVSPVGGGSKSANGVASEWLPAASDEESMLHQLRVALLQARDAPPAPQPGLFGLQSSGQERVVNPLVQECLDAVTEHQRLRLLMKGEWFKGLLPLSSVRPDAVVQRIRELAEGSCVKRYDFTGSGRDSKKPTNNNPELPSDAHLLLYLFCALLEHPQWMLHVDPYAHSSMQTGTNPLFLNTLPGNERFSEKHVAVLSNAPGAIIPGGACILAVGKQIPPVFALYWDKKLQFSLQGRTALWDAVLLLCNRIKVAHGGVVRGISLASPTYNLLPVLEPTSLRSPLR